MSTRLPLIQFERATDWRNTFSPVYQHAIAEGIRIGIIVAVILTYGYLTPPHSFTAFLIGLFLGFLPPAVIGAAIFSTDETGELVTKDTKTVLQIGSLGGAIGAYAAVRSLSILHAPPVTLRVMLNAYLTCFTCLTGSLLIAVLASEPTH